MATFGNKPIFNEGAFQSLQRHQNLSYRNVSADEFEIASISNMDLIVLSHDYCHDSLSEMFQPRQYIRILGYNAPEYILVSQCNKMTEFGL